LLSGRDPSTFLSTRSANFAAADSICDIAYCRIISNSKIKSAHTLQKKIVKIDIGVHSQRYMEQRYEAIDANQATAVKKILHGLRDPIELKQ
jgi:hypothetical protein